MKKSARGFTLLEVLVATLVMALAIVGLLSGLSTSLRNAARLTDHDRLAMLARTEMDEILVNRNLPLEAEFDGKFNPTLTGGAEAGYHVAMSVFEAPPDPRPGTFVLQRVLMRVNWNGPAGLRTFDLEAFRRAQIPLAPR